MTSRPGTVSKILWHFTGGPTWDPLTNRQLSILKPAANGYAALNSILATQELRLGNYKEVVKVRIPKRRVLDKKKKRFETVLNSIVEVKSSPVCCVADIPLQHISYHANRYGKIAIGFHRNAVVQANFNPVMYTLEHTPLLNSIYEGYQSIEGCDPWVANSEVDSSQSDIDELITENEIDESIDLSSISNALDDIDTAKDEITSSYEDFLAFIKTFDETEFDSIYCEREWRSIAAFNFNIDDIAIIVLPRKQEGFEFYKDFLLNTKLPRSVPIVAWEDLIEH